MRKTLKNLVEDLKSHGVILSYSGRWSSLLDPKDVEIAISFQGRTVDLVVSADDIKVLPNNLPDAGSYWIDKHENDFYRIRQELLLLDKHGYPDRFFF